MNDSPQPPRRGAVQPHETKIGDRRSSTDGGEAAKVRVAKRRGGWFTVHPCPNHPCNIASTLLRCRRKSGYGSTIPCVRQCCVADREDVGMLRHREITSHDQPPGVVCRGVQPLSCGRGDHPGCPQYCARGNALVADRDAVCVDVLDAGVEA